MPEVSSERRSFIPLGFEPPATLSSNLVKIAANATLFHFAVLTNFIHNAWMRSVCGRLKSDSAIRPALATTTFPGPTRRPRNSTKPSNPQGKQCLTPARNFPAPRWLLCTTPSPCPQRCARHTKPWIRLLGYGGGKDDASRVSFLFERYQALTSLLPAPNATGRKRPAKMASA